MAKEKTAWWRTIESRGDWTPDPLGTNKFYKAVRFVLPSGELIVPHGFSSSYPETLNSNISRVRGNRVGARSQRLFIISLFA